MNAKSVLRRTFVALIVFLLANVAVAQRPASYKLLPERTAAYLRIADVKDLVSRFQDTSLGRMAREQQLQSLTDQLYAEAEKSLKPYADRVGLSLTEMLTIPQGEITVAVVAPESGSPAPVVMMEIGNQVINANKLLDFMNAEMQTQGFKESTQTESGISMTVLRTTGERQDGVVYFQKDEVLVVTSHIEVAKQIAAAWAGDDEQLVLEDNEKFSAVMRHSKGPRSETPQIKWFVDPIDLVKVSRRGDFRAQAALAALPVLGLDGLQGLGGSVTMSGAEFDSFMQVHILLDEPRNGVLAMLALETGDPTPEDWVPNDVAEYQTIFWNVQQTESELQTLYDSFRGEGGFQRDLLERASERLGVDLSQDVLSALGGRLSLASWYARPARVGDQSLLGGVLLKDDHKFDATLDTIVETMVPDAEKKIYGSVNYYQLRAQSQDEDEGEEDARATRPRFEPCVAIIDNYLLVTNRPDVMEKGIRTRASASSSLASELDYKLITSKVRRQPGGSEPAAFAFARPEEGIRVLLDLASAEQTRQQLARGAENNEFLGTLKQALDDNPLPPFSVIRKYFAPTGSVLTSDESGIHYTSFGLRRNPSK